ncbi:bifunctional UDP-N-acetylglucosamine diphosphorylase/glucosamine-1-phosphate N-acetyltransferase GlmU [Kordiimonas sp. SCSIO 12610]|uniref:bifunctional UDP-N-acetylglucosamine diphosphorylase/glucosamine-1-phosphate N-acetyltransferase GlmU n=1 Tax=Kordiimonas sp. SCSIO 12610 TaxID=2829597 RepID=UPI00210D1B13|nr:bifunctional UDP-N-acetylglucosamine diphosphorylase/glucosamine-1-phosphate N-acetyltransferase GlmU [Kordiimonas sp. SCSIO 12610]UTW54882.1 bifunctional UDP-N-acetylglucosamine diphosphorylase/glucosamine-1-phosphate N-acetyltransferase GlmU [Kordiimonas sp. SCSIO 12610]
MGNIAAVILAAGKGTRMKSEKHKVLHDIAGQPMLFHLMDTVQGLGCSKQVLIVGSGREQLETAIAGADYSAEFAVQEEQLGTGHAVMMAEKSLSGFDGDVIILFGDTPFIPNSVMEQMLEAKNNKANKPGIVVLGFEAADPGKYGRLVLSSNGDLERIVEYKDATETERAISLCNSGMMVVDGAKLFKWLKELSNDNAAGEYYLTDLVACARADGSHAVVVNASEQDVMGVNSRADLAAAELAFQSKKRAEMMASGVTLIDPDTVYFANDTKIEADVIIEPNVFFGPNVHVSGGARIKAFSHLEGTTIGENASVGPFARLRPGAEIGDKAKIGNFVEVKKAKLGEGAKVSHLSYIGDAIVGDAANIGAGTITCNYDGFFKYQTVIGKEAFIGSNTALVAPVTVGDGAIVGAGSVISSDIDQDALGVTRAKQRQIDGFAAKFRSERLAKKEQK